MKMIQLPLHQDIRGWLCRYLNRNFIDEFERWEPEEVPVSQGSRGCKSRMSGCYIPYPVVHNLSYQRSKTAICSIIPPPPPPHLTVSEVHKARKQTDQTSSKWWNLRASSSMSALRPSNAPRFACSDPLLARHSGAAPAVRLRAAPDARDA